MHDYDLDNKRQYEIDFHSGVVSKQAREYWKDYWYNEFKRQKLQSDSGQDQSLRNYPLKPSECFNGKSEHKMIFGTDDGLTDQEKLDIEYGITPLGRQHRQYLKDNPDRPISFNNWKYMVEHYPNEPWIDCNDLNASIDRVQGKRPIGIIGHVDHDSSIFADMADKIILLKKRRGGNTIIVGETGVDDRIVASAHNIQSIVPIADVIPEKIQLTSFYDKISVPKEWDTRKQKKSSHKRNNKRRK